VALGYAAAVAGGVDAVALTHLDTACRAAGLGICRAYDLAGPGGGTVVSAIVPGPPRDLSYQESLTAALLKARPVYDPRSGAPPPTGRTPSPASCTPRRDPLARSGRNRQKVASAAAWVPQLCSALIGEFAV
jgi:adenylosuccinate synthase